MMNDSHGNRSNGVVYTPRAVAEEVARIGLLAISDISGKILEPSVGDGSFLSALLARGIEEKKITGIDIDEGATRKLEKKYCGAKIVKADFLEFSCRNNIGTFELVIGNPPYIKRVAYSPSFLERIKALANETGFAVGNLRNAWAAFIVTAAKLVHEGGALVFVVPYEMITVKYGKMIQRFLVHEGYDVEIYAPDAKAFPEIEQDAVILVAKKIGAEKRDVRLNRVESCTRLDPTATALVSIDNEKKAAIEVKSVLMDSEIVDLLIRLRNKSQHVDQYCESVAGIVTAGNQYFILNNDAVEREGLLPWARKIVKKASYLPKGPILSEEHFSQISVNFPCNLIDFHWQDSPPITDEAKKYIENCEEMKIHLRYKCKLRSPWYRIPIVEASDGLFFKRAHIFHRLCVNEAKVLVTDTAYQIRMRGNFGIRDLCFSFYNPLTLLFAEIDGRFYGGGVLELTPSEFRGLPVCIVKPTEAEFRQFVKSFPETRENEASFGKDDNCAIRKKWGLTPEQWNGITNALTVLREHRMRHAG